MTAPSSDSAAAAAPRPTLGLSLPAVRGRRERVARPQEARALIAALPAGDRALWATALYAGLRRGELQGLRWSDLDLKAGVIRVERSFDQKAGPIEPKSRSGRRRVALAEPLRAELSAHRLRQSESMVAPTAKGCAAPPAADVSGRRPGPHHRRTANPQSGRLPHRRPKSRVERDFH